MDWTQKANIDRYDRDIEQILIEKESGNNPAVIIRLKIEDFRMGL